MKNDVKKIVIKIKYLIDILDDEIKIQEKGKEDFMKRYSELTNSHYKESTDKKDISENNSEIIVSKELGNIDSSFKNQEKRKKLKNVASKNNTPSWVKKIYKKIVNRSHPDKTLSLDENLRNELIEIYQKTIDAYEKQNYIDIILLGSELFIYPEDLDGKKCILLTEKICDTQKKIENARATVFWIWEKIPHQNRFAFLKKFLKDSGHSVLDEDIFENLKK